MAATTDIKRVAKVIADVNRTMSDTFCEQAKKITRVCSDVFGRAQWLLPREDIDAVIDAAAEESSWRGTSSEAARRSEIAAVIRAYPYLGAACKHYQRETGELRREHMLKIARLCPQCETAQDAALLAVDFFAGKKSSRKKLALPGDKIVRGLTMAIKACDDDAVVQAIYRLCETHGIKISG